MNGRKHSLRGEDGFVMIASLLILLVLTLLGIAVNQNTDIEWRIAMNDRLHKETFYAADAATELAAEALEQSIACLGFRANTPDNKLMRLQGAKPSSQAGPWFDLVVEENSLGFWRNYRVDDTINIPENNARNMVYPGIFTIDPAKSVENWEFDRAATDAAPHANINIGGNTQLTQGSALQMAAGYEGVGKGMGGGGATLVYDINVKMVGRNGAESVICVKYGHVLGSSGVCNY